MEKEVLSLKQRVGGYTGVLEVGKGRQRHFD